MTQTTSLHEVRLDHAFSVLRASGARRVLDLGCGSGALLQRLLRAPQFTELVGLEQSGLSLAQARVNLADHLQDGDRLRLLCGSYQDRNDALTNFDAAAMIETIEHVPPQTLSRVEDVVFRHYRPRLLFMTTPNREYNGLFGLAPGEFREPDHTFEWDRARFRGWARGVAQRCGYRVRFGGIGEFHEDFGEPTQTATFERGD